jgi:hypothetical protein
LQQLHQRDKRRPSPAVPSAAAFRHNRPFLPAGSFASCLAIAMSDTGYADALALVERLNGLLDDLAVRGLRAVGGDAIARLVAQGEALSGIGAAHLAEAIEALVNDLRNGRREAARTLLKTRASVRVFERLLSLRMVAAELETGLGEGSELAHSQLPTPDSRLLLPAQGPAAQSAAVPADASKLTLLQQAGDAIEELLLAGTTTASQSTGRTLGAVFEEASRAGFLRLGASLRIVLEELKRLDSAPERFSGSRLAFFLDRAWLLAMGTRHALQEGDAQALIRLTAPPRSTAVSRLEVATLGVLKRHVPGAFSVFEFRFRLLAAVVLADGAQLPRGASLIWPLVLPARADIEVSPEAFLNLQQKQGFRPSDLLGGKRIVIEQETISAEAPHRINLGPDSTLSIGEALDDWSGLIDWQPGQWLVRLQQHRPDPLELPVEHSVELLLSPWQLLQEFAASTASGKAASERIASVAALGMAWRLRIDNGEDELERALQEASGSESPPALYASAHVELGQAVLTPLALLPPAGPPSYITIGPMKGDRAALVRALNRR